MSNVPFDAEKIIIGTDYIELSDLTEGIFKTTDPEDFKKFVKDNINEEAFVVYGLNGSTFYNSAIFDKGHVEPAYLELNKSSILKEFEVLINRKISLQSCRDLLLKSRKYFVSPECKDLLNVCTNFKTKAITSIDFTSDRAGNHNFSISREQKEGEELKIPESIVLDLPVYPNSLFNCFIRLEIEPWLEYDVQQSNVKIDIKLNCYDLEEKIENVAKKALSDFFKDIKCKHYWGVMDIVERDDKWKFINKNALPQTLTINFGEEKK